jgi:hypothetical protein
MINTTKLDGGGLNVSGSMGYVLLEKNGQYILLFSDIHDGVNYCSNVDSEFISKVLLDYANNNIILLEEAVKEPELNLKALWPNAKHTQQLKELSMKYQKDIKSIDIRPILIPFSWELITTNKKFKQIPFRAYISLLGDFFNRRGKFYEKYFKKVICDDEYLNKHHIVLNELYMELYNHEYATNPLIFFYNNDRETLYNLNYLLDLVMEYYMYIYIICFKNERIVIHTGMAHSQRMIEFLTKYYHYKVIQEDGINYIDKIGNGTPSACVKLPQNVKGIFDKDV